MPLWVQLVVVIAAVKNGAAVAIAWKAVATASPVRAAIYSVPQYAALIIAFSATGLTLILARTKDMRAVWLGSLLLVVATPFADTLFSCCGPPPAPQLIILLARTQVIALQPLFFWLFLVEFPQQGDERRWSRWHSGARAFTNLSIAVAIVLLASNLSELLLPITATAADPRALLSREGLGALFWPLVIGSSVPGLAFLAWKARAVAPADRRRIGVFAGGLLIGFAPIACEVLLEAIVPAYARLVARPAVQPIVDAVVF